MRAVSGLVGCVSVLVIGLSSAGADARGGGGRGGVAQAPPARGFAQVRVRGRAFSAGTPRLVSNRRLNGFGGRDLGRGRSERYGSGGSGFAGYGYGGFGYGLSGFGSPGASLSYPASYGPSPVVTPGPGEGSIPVGVGIPAPAVLPPAVYVLGGRRPARAGYRSSQRAGGGASVYAESRDAAGESGVVGRSRLTRLTADRP